ncbi:hypothetical protein D3C87_1860470 [compost metagenome]
MPQVTSRNDPLHQHPERTVFSRFKLIPDDTELAVEVLFRNERVHHPVGFEVERPFQVFFRGRKCFKIVGAVVPGGSIRACAVLSELLRDVGMLWRAFEYKVFEQVGHTGFSIAFMTGPY